MRSTQMKYPKLMFVIIAIAVLLLGAAGCTISKEPSSGQRPAAQQSPAAQQTPAAVQQAPATSQQPPATQQPARQQAAQQPPPADNDNEDDEDDGEVGAEITSVSGLSIEEGEIFFTGTIVIKVSNDTDDDVEDIDLNLEIEADDDIPDISYVTLTADDTIWNFKGQDDEVLEFSCPAGIDVDEGEYEKLTLTLYVYFEEEVDEDVTFDASLAFDDDDDDDNADEVTADIISTSGLSLYEGESYFSGTIRLVIYNYTDSDVDDVEITLAIEADDDIPAVSSAALTGSDIAWTFDDQDDEVLEFSCSSGLDIDEDEYEQMTLSLYVYFDETAAEGVTFTPSIEITDYD